MKVWISKYALTQGIFKKEAERCEICGANDKSDMIQYKDKGYTVYFHDEGREWHLTKEEAIKKAEEMRNAKIKSVKKQLDKLEKMKFE